MDAWTSVYDPLGNLLLSGMVAATPLLFLIFALGVLKLSAAKTVPIALVGAILIARFVDGMPARFIASATGLSLAQGMLPLLILVGAIAFQNVLVATGRVDLLRRSLMRMTPDSRLQVVFIGFCYGALLEAIAGGGTPVLITVSMLVGLGFNGFQSAKLCACSPTGRPWPMSSRLSSSIWRSSPGFPSTSSPTWSPCRSRSPHLLCLLSLLDCSTAGAVSSRHGPCCSSFQ